MRSSLKLTNIVIITIDYIYNLQGIRTELRNYKLTYVTIKHVEIKKPTDFTTPSGGLVRVTL